MSVPGGFPHHLLAEIHEQPRALRDTVLLYLDRARERVALDAIGLDAERARQFTRVQLAASGSSRHAALIAACMLEELARIPATVEHASEYQYRQPITAADVLTVVVSQSGETADTLGAQRLAAQHGSPTLAVCNVPESTMLRSADFALPLAAGPEVSIAATKSFTAQVAALCLVALYLAEARGALSRKQAAAQVAAMLEMPEKLERALQLEEQCRSLAAEYSRARAVLFLGRGVHYPIALDGALKLKETSYIPAEGNPGGEMSHGPNALLEEAVPAVCLAAHDRNSRTGALLSPRTLADMQQAQKLGARVVAVVVKGGEPAAPPGSLLRIPAAPELLLPLLEIVPLQFLACHVAAALGRDVDRPRNLSKSVREE